MKPRSRSVLDASGERRAHAAEAGQIHHHAVAGLEPQRLDEAPGQHDLARAQALAVGGEMIGEPGQRVVRMAEHVGAGAAADFSAVDDGAADHVEQIGCGGSRHRLAEHAAGGKEIVRHQSRRADGLPVGVAVVDDLDRRQIGLDGLRDRRRP